MGVAVRLRSMPSVQIWPENQEFPLSLTKKLVTDAGNAPLAVAIATALGQLEQSWARVSKDTKQMVLLCRQLDRRPVSTSRTCLCPCGSVAR